MTWLTWRQLRVQAAAVYALVIGAAVVLAVTGPALSDKARIYKDVFDHLNRIERDLYYSGVVVLAIAPAVIGAFWGAPLVARELEAGTHRLVWNQSVTRSRWLATKLGLTAAVAAAAIGALTFAITWWSGPVDGALSETAGSLPSRLTPVAFAMRGLVPVGYAVFAVVLGVAFGVLLRRSVPAMALTLAVFTAVQIAVPLWIRPHLIPSNQTTLSFSRARLDGINGSPGTIPKVTLNTGHPSDWILSNDTVDAAGRIVVGLPAWTTNCFGPPAAPLPGRQVVHDDSGLNACLARLNAEGYRQHIVYQPASHFWPLQFAETGLYLAVSGLLTWFCFGWTRRRLS